MKKLAILGLFGVLLIGCESADRNTPEQMRSQIGNALQDIAGDQSAAYKATDPREKSCALLMAMESAGSALDAAMQYQSRYGSHYSDAASLLWSAAEQYVETEKEYAAVKEECRDNSEKKEAQRDAVIDSIRAARSP